jgi:3-oxosteroid 1-dehydrogenase
MVFGGMMLTRSEAAELLRGHRSPAAAALGLRLTMRYLGDRLRGRRGTRLVLGNALVAHLLHAALHNGVEVRRQTRTVRLIEDQGRISGVEIEAPQGRSIVRARRGVVLAGGGFPASEELRRQELPKPTPRYTPASSGATGETLTLAQAVGAALGPSGLDNALWFPSSTMTRPDGSTAVWPHIVLDRAKPGSVVVDTRGNRFVNEAVSYHEFVRAMYRAQAVPCWMICDRAFIRRYGLGLIRPHTPSLRRFIKAGYLVEAPDAARLGARLGLPASSLERTLARFNTFARSGMDEEFHRGETIYERANGDPSRPDNPCLGEIGPGPLYAVRLEATPLGTSRGLLTDTNARVLRSDGTAIPGLFACGNDMHSIFGGEYPGAGAQLGQGMTFGWLAARAAAGLPEV